MANPVQKTVQEQKMAVQLPGARQPTAVPQTPSSGGGSGGSGNFSYGHA